MVGAMGVEIGCWNEYILIDCRDMVSKNEVKQA